MDSDDDNEEALRDRLHEMLGSDVSEASSAEISRALDEVAGEGDTESDEDPVDADATRLGTAAADPDSSADEGSTDSSEAQFLDSVSTAIEPFDVDREGALPLITVSPRDDRELSRVFGQVLDVHALWLEIERNAPALNESVEILLDIPAYGHESSLPGRVVHRDGPRVAVVLTGLTDRVLEGIREVFERHQSREHQKESGQSPTLDVDSSARGAAEFDVSQSWDGSPESSLALSRTFETVSEDETHWYGPRSTWLEPDAIGTSGELRREIDPEHLLLEVSEKAFSGLVEFASSDRRFQLQIEEGHVVEISGRPHEEHEELGPMLRVADRVSEERLGEVSSYAIEHEVSLQRALHELEVIPLEEIRLAVAGRLTYLLRMVCDLGAGTAQLTPRDSLASFPLPHPEVRIHLPVESVVFRRRIDYFFGLDADERDELIAEHADRHPRVVPEASGRIERAFVDSAHRSFVERMLDGSLEFEDLVARSFLPPAETASVLFALRSMDLVEFEEEPENSRSVELYEDDLDVQHLSVHKASYFEVLNVHWSGYDERVEAGYRRRRGYFDPDDAPDELPRKSRRKLDEIAERIEAAYRVLRSRRSRHEYRQKIMPEYKLEHAVPLLMRRGRLGLRRQRPDLARDAFRRVLEIEPDHAGAAEYLDRLSGGSGATGSESVSRQFEEV